MKIFSFNEGLNGSYISRPDGTVSVNTAGVFTRGDKGLCWYNDGTAKIARPSAITLSRQSATIEIWFKGWDATNSLIRFLLAYNSDTLSYCGQVTARFRLESNTNADYWLSVTPSNIIDNVWYHLLIIADGGTVNSYLNNRLYDTQTPADDVTFDTIGASSTSAYNYDGYIAKVILDDEPYTAQQRANAYEKFLKASPRGIELYPKPVLPERKPTDLSRYVDAGLCLAHNMIPSSGNLLVDTSNQNAPGAIDGATEILEGLSFDGKDDSAAINLSLALAATVKTICFRIKFASLTEMIHDGDASGSLIIDTNAGTLQYPAYDNAFIDGVDTDTIFADQWTDVVITSSTAVDNNTPTLGRTTAAAFTYGKFEIADLQYWSVEFTLQDAKDYHNSFVKPVLGRIPSVYDPVGSTWPFGMVQGTGSYIVDELTAQDAVLKELDIGTKFKRVTGAGTISVPTKQAYGTWEGFIYKGDTANRLYMILIANKIGVAGYVQGYALNFDNDEGIYLEKYDGVGGTTVLFATAASYITINTWYKYRFTRTLDGVMTLLLKGGALVPTAGYDGWTLAAPTGAYVNPTAADNTYTTCEYSVIDGGVLDRVILDHTDNGVKQ